MTPKRFAPSALFILLAATAGACTGEDLAGTGNLTLRASGAEAVRQGFPYQEAEFSEPHAFIDGWSLQFESFILTFGELELREPTSTGEEGPVVANWTGPAVVDMMNPVEGVSFATLEDVPAVRHDFSFSIVAPDATAENVSAQADDFARMQEEGWVFFMEGTATSSVGEPVRFEIGLETPTRFRQCANGVDETRGIALEANKTISATIYPHSVHFWWDVLLAGNPDLRFQPWADVADENGVITAQALATQDLKELRFDDAGELSAEPNLLRYVEYAFRQSVHFNGLGFCPWDALD